MVSNKIPKRGPRRPYKLKARARRQEQVHKRITLAAVHLHKTVGPAKTTMNAIAELAGVRRATVYNHFPTELELIDACSSHWFMENPPPDHTAWLEISDPVHRTNRALLDMYQYYEVGQEMLGKVLRDAPLVPAMDEIRRQKWQPMLEGMVEIIVSGWKSGHNRVQISKQAMKALRASLMVALDFFTWQTLTESGLSTKEAARLASSWVESSVKDSL